MTITAEMTETVVLITVGAVRSAMAAKTVETVEEEMITGAPEVITVVQAGMAITETPAEAEAVMARIAAGMTTAEEEMTTVVAEEIIVVAVVVTVLVVTAASPDPWILCSPV